ncbi:MAG: T9SS type A sorting domain-containing protein [Bacteroidota bacterium]
MKNNLLFLLLVLLLPVASKAQITMTNAHFPEAGDKLYFAVDTFPNALITDPSASMQSWYFEFLETDRYQVDNILNAATGGVADSFPDADIIVPFFSGDGYAKVHDDSIEVLGFFGSPTPGLADFDVFVRMDPPITTHRSDYTYGSNGFDDGFFHLAIDAADIPEDADLPFDPSSLDSMRMDFSIIRRDTADAWGTLQTHFGTFDVIRVKEYEYRNSIVDVKHPFFGWVNLNTFPIDGIGPDTLVYYNFLNDVSKEPIFRVRVNEQPTGVTNSMGWWKVDQMTVSNDELNIPEFSMSHYPNPATDFLNISFNGLPSGEYKIKVFNILGKTVSEIPINIFGDETIPIDLYQFNQGTYLYSLISETGQHLKTERFFVIRP